MRSLGFVAGLTFSLLAAQAHAEEKPYLIGFERTLSDEIVTTEGRSIAGYLSAALNHLVKGRIFKTYDDLADALAKGTIDLAWINPFSFVKASQISHIVPIAKVLRHGDSYRSVLFVRSDSKARTLADLKGLKVAWVDQSSTSGYLFPYALLFKQGLNPDRFFANQTFAGTHRGVCDAVLSGAADVGATFHTGTEKGDLRPDGCIETMGPEYASRFVGIVGSDPIPSEVIAARAGFEEAVTKKLTEIFVGMSDTDTGRQLLKNLFRADGFGTVLDTDYDVVRAAAQSVADAKAHPDQQAPTVEQPKKKHSKKKKKKSRSHSE